MTPSINAETEPLGRFDLLRSVLEEVEAEDNEIPTPDQLERIEASVEAISPEYFRRQYWLRCGPWFVLGILVARCALGS